MTQTPTTASPEPGAPVASRGPGSGPSKGHATDNRSRLLLALVLTGQFMGLLDLFVVNVAAPSIRAELHASGTGLQLIVSGYTVSYAVLLITGARLGARFGHGRTYLCGLAVFTVASLACGLAGTTGQLTAFRVVQGAGAAVLMPQVLSLIQQHFTGVARTRALGAFSAVIATGASAGQVLGGALVTADLFGTGWRPAFLVNVPIGLALLVLGSRVLLREQPPAPQGIRKQGMDTTGLLLLGTAVCLCTVPLVLGRERDWPLWCWLSLAAATLPGAVLIAHERRLARRGGRPLISPEVLRAPGMPGTVLGIGLVMAANAGYLFALSLHFQGGLGHSALRTGLSFAPTAVCFGVAGLTWQRLPAQLGRTVVPCGLLLGGVSYAAVGLLLRDGGDGGGWLYVAFMGVGAGIGLGYGPALTRGLAAVPQRHAADASGLLTTVTQLGTLLGVAAFGTLFLDRLAATGSSGGAIRTTALGLAAAAVLGALVQIPRRDR